MDIGNADIQTGRHDAERAAGQHDALVVEARHQHLDAAAFLVQHIFKRHFDILENQLAGVGAAHAELVELLRDREPGHLLFDDEGGDAARFPLGIGLGVDDHRVGVRPVGDPHLGAVEHEAVVFLFRPEPHRDDV